MNIEAIKGGFSLLILAIGLVLYVDARGQEHFMKAKYGLQSEDYKLPSDAIELTVDYIFPTSEAENNGVFLASPQGFFVSPEGSIYISDVRNSEIYTFDISGTYLRTIGRFGQGPGEFMMPKQLAFLDKKLMVRDIGNMKIQFFDQLGNYLDAFRVFRDYYSLVACDGYIYGIPIIYPRVIEGKACYLVDVLDPKGHLTRSFGALVDTSLNDENQTLREAYLVVGANKELWVAFQCFPIVRKYSLKGDLLAEHRLSNGIVDKKASFNRKKIAEIGHFGGVQYYFITSAIHATAKGLYLLGTSEKRLDIVLIDNDGNQKEFYWLPLERKIWSTGLFVLEEDDNTKFFVLDLLSARVEVYSTKHH